MARSIATDWGTAHPFEVPNLKDRRIRLLVGFPNDGSDPTTLWGWANNNGDYYVMRRDADHKIWSIEDATVAPERDPATQAFKKLRSLADRNIAAYLTGTGHPRGAWRQGYEQLLLGPADGPISISRGGKPADGTGVQGDIVFSEQPEIDMCVGYICVGPAKEWKSFGKLA